MDGNFNPVEFNPWLAFGWCVLCGFLMSMGAGGGGILAGIGHISILGVADANMIKVVNQILEFTSRLVSVPLYYRQRRLVWRLALWFGAGAAFGAIAGSWVSKTWLSDMSAYRVVFGVLVVGVAARVLWEGWMKKGPAGAAGSAPPDFSRGLTALGGFCISFVGSLIGVGGGFLVTPFLAVVLLFPMALAVGTGLLALMIPLTVSVLTYLALHVNVDWGLVAVEVPGILAGSFLGPMLNRYMNEKALKTFVAVVLLAIGVYYVVF